MTHWNKEDKEIQLDQVFSFYLKPVINSFHQSRLEILKPKLNSSFFFFLGDILQKATSQASKASKLTLFGGKVRISKYDSKELILRH